MSLVKTRYTGKRPKYTIIIDDSDSDSDQNSEESGLDASPRQRQNTFRKSLVERVALDLT
jgi:hypothetical protein